MDGVAGVGVFAGAVMGVGVAGAMLGAAAVVGAAGVAGAMLGAAAVAGTAGVVGGAADVGGDTAICVVVGDAGAGPPLQPATSAAANSANPVVYIARMRFVISFRQYPRARAAYAYCAVTPPSITSSLPVI